MADLGVVPIRDSGSRSAFRLAKFMPVSAVAAATRLPAAFVNRAPSAGISLTVNPDRGAKLDELRRAKPGRKEIMLHEEVRAG
jgi:hypothetical protein